MLPAVAMPWSPVLAESGGGALLALGLATPLAEAVLISVMLTAIRTVHWKNGPWATNGGYEYNVVLISALLGLAEAGPGSLSLDRALGIERLGLAVDGRSSRPRHCRLAGRHRGFGFSAHGRRHGGAGGHLA